eukprot:gene11229-14050_t
MPALHAACRDGNYDAVVTLIEKNGGVAFVNERDGLKYTPLHYAARKGSRQIVNILMGEGAEVDALNNKGQSVLYQAVVGGHVETVRALIQRGADSNIKTKSGITALHFSARSGPIEMVMLLLGAGANTSTLTPEGLHSADVAKRA